MKIAQVVCTYPPHKSGIGNSACQFGKTLKKHGHHITTFTPEDKKRSKKTKNIIKIKPWLKYGKGAVMPQLFFLLKNFDYIFLHYPFFGTSEIIWLFKIFFCEKKIIIYYHMDVSGLPFFAKILSWPSKIIRKSLFKKADKIICSSFDYIKNSDIKNFYQRYPKKFIEIPFGIDLNNFKPLLKKTTKTKKILFVSSLDRAHYFKGIAVLLKAAANLKLKNWQLIIVGDGDQKNNYENMAKKYKINKKVKFLGSITNENLKKVYQKADFFVLPSTAKGEAFGIVLIEAMASGLPLIASNLPGVRSIFDDKIQGFKVDPGNYNDLKKKMEIILKDDKLRKKMGLEARKLAEKKYNWEKIGKKLNNTFIS